MNRRNFLQGTAAAGLTLSVSRASAEPAVSAPRGQAASGGAAFIEHDYDPVSDHVVWRAIDRNNPSLGQSFTVPEGATQISGFRAKVRRLGEAPHLRFRLGRRYGADDIASGVIEAATISPFFEYFAGTEFPARPCDPGRKYFLQFSLAAEPSGEEGYELYGTSSEGETPANQDYGARTPTYEGGEALDSAGQPIAHVDFAFEIYFGTGGFSQTRGEGEERFSFVKDLVQGPFAKMTRFSPTHPGADEFVVDSDWQIVSAPSAGEVIATAVADFRRFLDAAAGVKLGARVAEPAAALNAQRAIVVGRRGELPQYAAGLERSESFHIEAKENSITVCGYDERGIMRGLYYLEDRMSLREGPILFPISVTRRPRLSPRITCAPFLADQELDVPVSPYTDGLLSLISHHGFNAIWLFGNIHDLGRSQIFPELGEGAPLRMQRLNALIARARKYGIDVYLYLGKNPLPPEFFDQHPEVKGCAWAAGWKGTGFLMCTSARQGRAYIEQATASIFQQAPGLKGIVFIFGNEGFMHDYMAPVMSCPRCQNRSPFEVVSELIAAVNRGAKAGRADAQVVAWPYSGGRWTVGDPDQMKIIEQLPPDVIFQANFETTYTTVKGVERDGVDANIFDYSISNLGPSGRFQRQARALAERHMAVWAKTEFSYAQEFVQCPYIPVLQRWQERFKRIAAMPEISGAFMNWQHYGFMPSRCAEIAKWYTWEPQPDLDPLLKEIATRDFGAAAALRVVEAWALFSHALGYYPFAQGTTILGPVQKGPAHPLFFDANYRPVNSKGRNFTNDLQWTLPYGPEITAKYFGLMREEWQRGVALLEEALHDVAPGNKTNLEREIGIARVQLACVNTALNFIAFCQARLALTMETSGEAVQHALDQMAEIARRELNNAQQVLPYVQADSRLGYANSALTETIGVGRGGIFSPQSIEKKIACLHRLLDTEIRWYRPPTKS